MQAAMISSVSLETEPVSVAVPARPSERPWRQSLGVRQTRQEGNKAFSPTPGRSVRQKPNAETRHRGRLSASGSNLKSSWLRMAQESQGWSALRSCAGADKCTGCIELPVSERNLSKEVPSGLDMEFLLSNVSQPRATLKISFKDRSDEPKKVAMKDETKDQGERQLEWARRNEEK